MKINRSYPLSLIMIICSVMANAQVGTQFMNYEESNYLSSMKSANFTYLIWDRNHNGNGLFSVTDRPMFMYWDNDNGILGYMLDTRNMVRLKASFYSLKVSENVSLTNGSLGIGTTIIPSGYRLAVDGKIIAEEVKVSLSGSWPDYVFSPTYNLRSLEETEAFIKVNNHLPEVPSAKEVEEEGISLGEMNAILLKKIEELTLYQIEDRKMIKKQGEIIEELKRKIEE